MSLIFAAPKSLPVKLFSIAFILVGVVFQAQTISFAAGEVDSTFNLNAGKIEAAAIGDIKIQPDGKILVSGNFTAVNDTNISSIARFNADGTLDTSFNPPVFSGLSGTINNTAGPVFTMTLLPDGKILIGGNFASVGNQPRRGIARLNADGSLDQTFAVSNANNLSGHVNAFAVQPDGRIIVGGAFTITPNGGQTRTNLIRLNPDGTIDSSYLPVSYPEVFELAMQTDGKVLVGSTSGIHRLALDGSFDTSFAALGNANGAVRAIAFQPDGNIIIGGSFTNFGGFPRNRLTRLTANGVLDPNFNQNGQGVGSGISELGVSDIGITPDGKIVIVGDFFSYNSISRNNIARINADGTLDTTFTVSGLPSSFRPVTDVAVQTDGKIIAGGTNNSQLTPNILYRFNTNGSIDSFFQPNLFASSNSVVVDLAVQPDGKILVGGPFDTIGNTVRRKLARLNADGTLDFGFVPNVNIGTGVGGVYAIAPYLNGKVIVGGELGRDVQRLNADGTYDNTFDPQISTSSVVSDVATQPDGKVLVGGSVIIPLPNFEQRGLVRLNADGTRDTSFNPVTSGVTSIVLQSDGKILIAGGFTQVNGQNRGRIARLNPDGSLDATFNSPLGANGAVNSVAIQPDGKIVIVGNRQLTPFPETASPV